MKTIRKLLYMTILAWALFSCSENDEPKPTAYPHPNPAQKKTHNCELINGAFSLTSQKIYESINTGRIILTVSMQGDGVLNAFGPATLSLSHKKFIETREEKLLYTVGRFSLKDKLGDELFGNYNSSAFVDEKEDKIKVTVWGGTGKFDSAYGNLQIDIQDRHNNRLNTSLTGKVHLKKEINNSKEPQ